MSQKHRHKAEKQGDRSHGTEKDRTAAAGIRTLLHCRFNPSPGKHARNRNRAAPARSFSLFPVDFRLHPFAQTLADRVEGVTGYENADRRVLDERWQQPGDYSFYKDIADRSVSNATSRFVQDYNYLEMSNISISYRLPREWMKKIGFSSARIGLNTNDLFYVSTVKRERGLDYPFAREFTFSLNLNF